MLKRTTLVMATVFLVFSAAFPQTAPVQYLAGQSEAGQPHLYWFGAAATEVTLFYDDGTAQESIFVWTDWADNQVLVRFGFSAPFFVVNKLSARVSRDNPSDTAAYFDFTVRKDTGSSRPGPVLSTTPVAVHWNGLSSVWSERVMNVLITGDTTFWGSLNWLQGSPTNPRIGDDRSENLFRTYIGFQDNFFLWTNGGNLMIRANVLFNNPTIEQTESFWIYRGMDPDAVVHVATVDGGQFDFVEPDPLSGNYYYRVSRWQNGEESDFSNAVLLSASPTSVKDREKEHSVFLLSEPFPNPFSIGVLFTARTEKQMELGFLIYNLLGQKVFSQSSQIFSAGEHRFHWRGEDASGTKLPSGAYFLRFQAGEETIVKKLLLLH